MRARRGKSLTSTAAALHERSDELLSLLGRRQVSLDTPELQRFIASKTILVSGAGGSIGSEICRQLMRFCPQQVILLEQAENALFEIDQELRRRWVGAELVPVIADICDARRINLIFQQYKPSVVFHAAAHKHVPMMELNPGEAVKNNVFGTKTIADAALAAGVQSFVMISTDKAVNPTSVMGAAKRVAELYVQSLNEGQGAWGKGQGDTEYRSVESGESYPRPSPLAPCPSNFMAVRFGNVLGSSGSVVPIFEKQIAAGGPVTVTHPDMQRYFMTIPEASQLVMQAGAMGHAGSIFILDMGKPVKILDLAKSLIRKHKLIPDKDIQIKFTGMRPGEKLFEELACDNEETRPTRHEKIRVWQLPRASRLQIKQMLDRLTAVINSPREEVIAALRDCIPEYQPDGLPQAKPSHFPHPTLRLASPIPDEQAA